MIFSSRAKKLFFRLGLFDAQFLEDVLVVDEAVDDRGHGHAEGRLAIIRRPGALRHIREVGHGGEVVQRRQVALVVELERGIEGTAGDDVTRGAALEAGVEGGIVFLRRRRVEFDNDVRVLGLEGGDDLFLPDGGVVVAPALDGQRAGRGRAERARLAAAASSSVFSPDFSMWV